MEVVARIQGHPARSHLHAPLAAALGIPNEIVLHESEPPSPWLGYRLCLSEIPSGPSHVLIVQDDAIPCPNFAAAVVKVAESNPDVPVCLFLGGSPSGAAIRAGRAMTRGIRYVPLHVSSFVPLVAVLWPVEKAREFLEWADSHKTSRADDGNAAKWARATRQEIRVCVPSLVQHNDFTPTVKGGREHVYGQESWRQAMFLAEDGLAYEW